MPGLLRAYDVEIDLDAFQVKRGSRIVRLERQPMELLVLLVRRHGALVSREDIVGALWADNVFIEVDQSINTAIRKIRRALRDDPERPRFVETVVGKGYRFIAPVTEVRGGADVAGLALPRAESAPATRRRPGRETGRRLPGLLAGLLLLILLAVGWRWLGSLDHRPIRRLAVLPLVDLSSTQDQDYFAQGLTEALITELARAGGLEVISHTSVLRYKRSRPELAVPEIGRELRADAVIEGAVLRANGRVRITAQLIDARRDRHVWADTYEREEHDVLAMQAEVAAAIASAIRWAVVPADGPRRARRVVPEAHDAYLRGRYAWNRRTEPELRKAIEYFREASRLDPGDPLPFAGLADALTALGYFSYLSPQDSFVPARQAAETALALNPALAEPYASRGYVRLYHDWDFAGAEQDFRQALALDPSYALAHQWYAVYLSAMRRFDDARTELERARALDPNSLSVMTDRGWQLYLQGDYTAAAESLRSTLKLEPGFPLAHLWLGRTLQQQERHGAAIAEFEQLVAALPTSIVALVQLAHAQAVGGRAADARRTFALIEARGGTDYVTPYGRALVFAALSERELALEWLERSVDERSHWLVWLPLDPRWHELRGERRFQAVAARVGVSPG